MNRFIPAALRAMPGCRAIALLLLALAAVGASVCPALAQDTLSAASGSPRAIAEIRARYAETERDAPGYRRTVHDLWGFSTEGGELTAFYNGNELRKLAARIYGEMGRSTEELYFADGGLIFVHHTSSRYDRPFGRVASTSEERLYFEDGRLIRRIRSPQSGSDDADAGIDTADLPRWVEVLKRCAAATGDDPPECTARD